MKQVQLEIVLGTIFVFLSGALIIVFGIEEPARLSSFEDTQRAESIEFGANVFELNCTGCHGAYAQGIPGVAPCLRCRELFAPIAITIAGEKYEVNSETDIASDVIEGRNVRVEYSEDGNKRTATLVEVVDVEIVPSDANGIAVGIVDRYKDRLGELGWEGSLEDYVNSVVSTGRQVSTRPQYIGGGSPAMPTWSERYGGPLRVDQVAAVSAFIVNFETWALNPDLIPAPLYVEIDETDPASRGRAVFLSPETGCIGCHTITNISVGTLGPLLDGLASRAGDREAGLSAEAYIRKSVLDPASYLVEGFENIMPAGFGDIMTEEQLEDLIAFLLTLE